MLIITTQDGSHTLFHEELNEFYHSAKGAIQEGKHVFIKEGLNFIKGTALNLGDEIRILEIGFGTGLNALLTMLEAEAHNLEIHYETIELYPLPIETIKDLNYTQELGYEFCYGPYHTLHLCRWNETHQITKSFSFKKINDTILTCQLPLDNYQLIYFDAFSPEQQPEMWTNQVFKKLFDALRPNGILVTYCSKVSVQQAMKEAGFIIEKLPGAPGKREMLRAHKK